MNIALFGRLVRLGKYSKQLRVRLVSKRASYFYEYLYLVAFITGNSNVQLIHRLSCLSFEFPGFAILLPE